MWKLNRKVLGILRSPDRCEKYLTQNTELTDDSADLPVTPFYFITDLAACLDVTVAEIEVMTDMVTIYNEKRGDLLRLEMYGPGKLGSSIRALLRSAQRWRQGFEW